MSKFGQYNIVLKDITDGTRVNEYELDDVYFAKIDSPEVQKGKVRAKVSVVKKTDVYEISFNLEGTILIPCIIPESEGSINVAWFLYEFIVLNIPIKHIHAPGECNKNMVDKLKRHITRQKDDTEDNSLFEIDDDDLTTEDSQVDPRWDNLQNINFDNN